MSYAPEIMKTVKLMRLRWLEQLARANEISPCRKLKFFQARKHKKDWKTQLKVAR
jgi:hypothetical protein